MWVLHPSVLHFRLFYYWWENIYSTKIPKDTMKRFTALLLDSTKHIRCELGEAPICVKGGKRIVWVDVMSSMLYVYDENKKVREHCLKEKTKYVSTVVPTDLDGDTFLLGTKEGFGLYNIATKTFQEHPCNPIHNMDRIAKGSEARMNDGKVDPTGCLWAGSLVRNLSTSDLVSKAAALYVLKGWSKESPPERVLTGITCSNGIAWTTPTVKKNGTKMYYTDSPTFAIDVFDFEKSSPAAIARTRKPCVKVSDSFPPVADGLVVDREGFIWAAHFGAGCVKRYDPSTGKAVATIDLPTQAGDQTTAVAWGGPNYSDLFITTAHEFWSEEKKKEFPLAGRLFHVPEKNMRELCGYEVGKDCASKRAIGVEPFKFRACI